MIEKQVILNEMEDCEVEALKGRKKLAILFIKEIIEDYSNYCHALSATDIIRCLDRFPYSLEMERKAVSRIINILNEEYPYIIKNEDGRVWYDSDLKAA